MSAATLQIATPTDTTIVMTRRFNAPRQLVWDAMTDPQKLPLWMYSPEGWTMTTSTGDLRVGGDYRWAWSDKSGKEVMVISGVYKEFTPPSRIVHTETMEMVGCGGGPPAELLAAIDLTERGDGTLMTMTLSFATKAERDGALKWGMEHGMEAGYKTLDRMFAGAAV